MHLQFIEGGGGGSTANADRFGGGPFPEYDLAVIRAVVENRRMKHWLDRRRADAKTQRRQGSEWQSLTGKAAALGYAEAELKYYEYTARTNFGRWRKWQIVAVFFGVIGTLAAAITLPATWAAALAGWGWLRAVPVAIGSLANALLASFSYQAESVRQATATDAVRGEIALLITGSVPYGGTEAVDVSAFIINIRSIVSAEHGRWSDEMRTHVPAKQNTKIQQSA